MLHVHACLATETFHSISFLCNLHLILSVKHAQIASASLNECFTIDISSSCQTRMRNNRQTLRCHAEKLTLQGDYLFVEERIAWMSWQLFYLLLSYKKLFAMQVSCFTCSFVNCVCIICVPFIEPGVRRCEIFLGGFLSEGVLDSWRRVGGKHQKQSSGHSFKDKMKERKDGRDKRKRYMKHSIIPFHHIHSHEWWQRIFVPFYSLEHRDDDNMSLLFSSCLCITTLVISLVSLSWISWEYILSTA